MTDTDTMSIRPETSDALRRKLISLYPAAAALLYPFLLQAFHAAVGPPGGAVSVGGTVSAAILLLLAFVVPVSGLACAWWWTSQPGLADLRARRVAYAGVAVPPLFVFVGVVRGYVANLLVLAVSDIAIWIVIWLAAALLVWFGGEQSEPQSNPRPFAALRVAHGTCAVLITCFVLFHLTNHLFGLAGPDVHAGIMKAGRAVYRSAFVEPVLVLALVFQAASGVRLAWHWSGVRADAYRVFQIGSGVYLAAFLLAHLNSGLIAARHVYKIESNWAWAAGAPDGLIHGAWNIRLLPHYALGVFFILSHLASGLRVVLLAHGVRSTIADRVWWVGLAVAAAISATIMCALCGVRV